MDKQTLSNYGWIVIAVLVLAVMIALATPFGQYIRVATENTLDGLFETQESAVGVIKDEMGIVPSTDELQSKYKFDYYSTLSGAVADVNANTIGVNADSNKTDATAGVYTDKGKIYVVLLKDTTETSRITVSADMTINLGGNVLTFDNSTVGIDTVEDNRNTVTIDGRLKGSKIHTLGQDKSAVCIQNRTGTINVNGGTYVGESDSNMAFTIYFGSSSTGTVSNCTVSSTSQSNTAYSIYFYPSSTGTVSNCTVSSTNKNNKAGGIYFSKSTTGTVENCTVSSTSQSDMAYGIYFGSSSTGTVSNCTVSSTNENDKAYGMYFYQSSTGTVENCTVLAYSNYTDSEDGYSAMSCGIGNSGTLTVNDCYVMGTHSGIVNHGAVYINGGTYEGYGHGGFYLSGSNTTSHIKNATIRQCNMPTGYIDNGAGCNGSGFYIGGSDGNNINVYMDNCDIYGNRQPIVLRGSEGEQNNSLYISNSNINTSAKIRIDNDTHKLYIGKGNNFTANNTNRTSAVITTDEIYCQ